MLVKLASIGDGRKVLVLDSESLKELGASEAEAFEVSRNGDVIELRPAPVDRKAHVRALAEVVMDQHDDTFRKLSK